MHKCSLCEYVTADDMQFIEHLRAHQVLTKGDVDVLAQLEEGRKVGGHDGDLGTGPPGARDKDGGPGDSAPPADLAVEQEPGAVRARAGWCYCCCKHRHNRRKPGAHCADCFGGYCFGGWHGPGVRENLGAEAARRGARRAPYPTTKGWRQGEEK
jgi:hypothetical protein